MWVCAKTSAGHMDATQQRHLILPRCRALGEFASALKAACSLLRSTGVLPQRGVDPATDLLMQNWKRHRAIIQNCVMEGADVELAAQSVLGSAAFGEELQLANLVRQRLCRPRDITLRFPHHRRLGKGSVVAQASGCLVLAPALPMDSDVHLEAARTPHVEG